MQACSFLYFQGGVYEKETDGSFTWKPDNTGGRNVFRCDMDHTRKN